MKTYNKLYARGLYIFSGYIIKLIRNGVKQMSYKEVLQKMYNEEINKNIETDIQSFTIIAKHFITDKEICAIMEQDINK